MHERLVLFACSVQILHQPLEPRAIERLEHGSNVDPGWQRAFLLGHKHQPSGGDWKCTSSVGSTSTFTQVGGKRRFGGRKFNDRPASARWSSLVTEEYRHGRPRPDKTTAEAHALEQRKADWSEASAPIETRLGDKDETAGRGSQPRPGDVQPGCR